MRRAIRWAIVLAVLVPMGGPAIADAVVGSETPHHTALAQDALRPEISDWGLEGDPSALEPFDVWAEVHDSGSGVKNVSLVIRDEMGNVTKHPLSFNDSLYVAQIQPLRANHTYVLFVEAFDNSDNVATSYSRTIDTHVSRTSAPDPSVTMPYVVGSTLAVAGATCAAAVIYDRHRSRTRDGGAQADPSSE
ncbi:MAG: hypothetical protein ACTSPE_06820 [Candidatus Thorarchaeota archaeon]